MADALPRLHRGMSLSDVFISYKRERRPAAWHLQRVLSSYGFDAWYDYGLIPGEDFELQLLAKLRASKVCVVLWCQQSRSSEWVLKEATEALRLGRYLPVQIEPDSVPAEFRQFDAIDISGWDGSPISDTLFRLIADVGRRVDREPTMNFTENRNLQEAWVAHGRPSLMTFATESSVTRGEFKPPQASANLATVATKPASFRPPPPEGAGTNWPRVPKLKVEQAQFSLSARFDGSLESGDCVLSVRSVAKAAMSHCRIFVSTIDDGTAIYPVNELIGKRPEFPLGPGQIRPIAICTRDFADDIGKPPWLLRIRGKPWPLYDGQNSIVRLELQSEHDYPTIVDLELKIGQTHRDLSARVLKQYL